MSLWESGESSGEVSLAKLFAGEDPMGAAAKDGDIEKVAFMLCRGGWPLACELSGKVALRRAFAYLDAVVKSDISRVDGVKRDETRAREFDPLMKIHDAYLKMLIVRTKHDVTDCNGVRVIDIVRWLDARNS